jgi:ABC-type Fe3+/spermidine/putrescine transport system ATPase subunit
VAVAVRPERIRLAPAAPAGPAADNAVPATVEECIFRGALRRYRVRLPHGRLWSVDEAAAGDGVVHPVGTPVRLSWRAEDCLVLPEERADPPGRTEAYDGR